MNIDGVIINAEPIDILNELKRQLSDNNIHLFAKMVDSGKDIMVCCPYHKEGRERRPSAGIRKSDGMFHCLACGETHSLPEVIAHCFGKKDALWGYKWLIKTFSTTEVQSREAIKIDWKRNIFPDKSNILDDSVHNKSVCITEQELDSYRYTHPYMYKRGLSDNVIELFDIGYDEKTDSITFPVRYWGSANFGKCLFVARRQVTNKQFNIPNNIQKPLYGLYEIWLELTMQAFNTGRGQNVRFKMCDKVYVCEGLFDCLRFWCNGKFAVAGFGCLFSNYQLMLLDGLPTRNIVLALDNDKAGREATKRLRKAIKHKIIKEVILPEGRKDIGECTDEEIQNLKEVF